MHLLPKTKPTLLRDVLAMKRERGDADIADFRQVASVFAYGLDASIAGAEHSMAQWVARRSRLISDRLQAKRVAFLADLRAVMAGEFGQREAA